MSLAYAIDGLIHRRGGAGTGFELVVPSLAVERGSRIALVGPSGSGKSTLLDILALILMPDSVRRFDVPGPGGALVDVTALLARREHTRLARLRNRGTGYVLQTGGLLPFLSVSENIALPRSLLGLPDDGAVRRIAERLRIERHLSKKPSALSVGERQRVAIARALAHEPAVVLADEPTAALDPENSDLVMSLLIDLAEDAGTTVILASHDWDRMDRFGFVRVPSVIERTEEQACVRSVFTH